jgi:octaprenyl-diphosphate synthase
MSNAPVLPKNQPSHAFAGVFSTLSAHMAALDQSLREQLAAFEPEIRAMADYCVDTSGKRIRPALVFLSGWKAGGVVEADLVRAATVVELVHLATLVHDDIMDHADVRRNRSTATKEFGPTPAVLLGDALFAHALNLATLFPTTEVCAAVSESTRRVCAGEIVQTLRRGSANVTREDYRRIIDLKTAELFRVSCFLGGRLSGKDSGFVDAVSRFGRHLGIAYQIYDDLADFFGEERRIGKTLGTDYSTGKLTLPLFILLERLKEEERALVMREVTGSLPPQAERRILQMRELGVFDAVATEVDAELALAEADLRGRAPDSPLLNLADILRLQVRSLKSP